jgi:uncharacterized protein (DUF1810 family)
VFPQIAGLGQSEMSRRYAIGSLEEAQAYIRHPLLGTRLIESARTISDAQAGSAAEILGGIDAHKLHSSMTLFMRADPGVPVFRQVLDKYFAGRPDSATDQRL